MQHVRRQVRRAGSGQPLRLWRSAAGALRFHGHPASLAAARCGRRSGEYVALRAGAAGGRSQRGDAGRGLDAAGADPAPGRPHRRGAALGEGRRAQSDGFVQGARPFLRSLHVRGAGHQEGGDSLGGQRGQRHGGVRGGGRHRGAHLHAARRSAIQLPGVHGVRRAAAAGIEAHIFMPRDVPQSNYLECMAYGAHVTLVDGLISDRGRMVAELASQEDWFDVSTLKEPYRIEGKKTMGYEVAEQMGWELPDAIFYPTGGGVGMIGMWKAFDEMEKLGWICSRRPKMIAVQADGCQPVVRAYLENEPRSRFWDDAHTVASGLRVPKPLGDFLVLNAVRESGGTAIAVSDEDMLEAGVNMASDEGIFAAPEGAACVDAASRLLRSRFLKSTDRIVIYNTGSGLKYPEAYSTRFPRSTSGEQDKLGGLITPR